MAVALAVPLPRAVGPLKMMLSGPLLTENWSWRGDSAQELSQKLRNDQSTDLCEMIVAACSLSDRAQSGLGEAGPAGV